MAITTKGALATALIAFAAKLNEHPEEEIPGVMMYTNSYTQTKKQFLDYANAIPRPIKKEYNEYYFNVTYTDPTSSLCIKHEIDRSRVCRKISEPIPAQWECEPLLSTDETDNIPTEAADD